MRALINQISLPFMLEIAVDAAKKAGQVILQGAENLSCLNIEQKSTNDFVSEVDRNAESVIVETLLAAFPNHTILGEENGVQGKSGSDYTWVIDPLDGTTNFLRAIPHYAVSIALMKKTKVIGAVVYDPVKEEMFTASYGQGAYLNGHQLTLQKNSIFEGGLYATGIPFNGENLANIASFTNTMQDVLAQKTSGIRRLGAAALDLAYVAAGRFDGFWESRLNAWDIAAGVLLVQEAGGLVSDFDNQAGYLDNGNIVAGVTKDIHNNLLNIVAKNY